MGKSAKTRGAPVDADVAELRARARAAGKELIDALLVLVRESKSEAVKLSAIKEVLDRGFGRPGGGSGESGGAPVHLLVDDGYGQ